MQIPLFQPAPQAATEFSRQQCKALMHYWPKYAIPDLNPSGPIGSNNQTTFSEPSCKILGKQLAHLIWSALGHSIWICNGKLWTPRQKNWQSLPRRCRISTMGQKRRILL